LGVYDLRLSLDWMEHLTLEEFHALMDRHTDELHLADLMHARTAQSMRGGRLDNLLLFPSRHATPKEPPSFADVCRIMRAERAPN
jgi:hypothetical protein